MVNWTNCLEYKKNPYFPEKKQVWNNGIYNKSIFENKSMAYTFKNKADTWLRLAVAKKCHNNNEQQRNNMPASGNSPHGRD